MLGIYSFYWDCGRNGNLEGIFVAEKTSVEKIVGKDVYFGEVLGKHSEISGKLEEADFDLLTDDQEFISQFVNILGLDFSSGFNPFNYLEDYLDEDEDCQND